MRALISRFSGIGGALPLLLNGILLLFLIAAVVTDRRLSIRRDWLHWTGVCVKIGGLLGALANFAYVMFGRGLY